ncbi:MAG: transcriptional regulator [Calothrix sp. SM1_7_51]|nr:transcriptional regulator [Calothrix sp. SM1_7_51]
MNTDSQFEDSSQKRVNFDSLSKNAISTNELTGDKHMEKRDRFELLSAYLDGEVTAAERKQVEEWLASDPSVQNLHRRLLSLRQGLRSIPIPQSQLPVEDTVKQVMTKLRRRSQRTWALRGAAVAACLIGAVSGLLLNNSRETLQFAQKTPSNRHQLANQLRHSPILQKLYH